MKFTKIVVILSSYFSYTLGKNAIFYSTFMIANFIGTALDVWEFVSNVTTLLSLQFEHMELSVFRTYSEMKELASNVFFNNFEKTASNSESSNFLHLLESSFKVITAFLLRLDLKLSTNLIIYGVKILIVPCIKISL